MISDHGDGGYNSECQSTSDCQQDLVCFDRTCHCADPMVFELHEERCVIPLGKSCDSSDLEHEDTGCPQFAECFMDRCVCKENYHMHTMSRCRSDLAEMHEPRKTVLWPRPTSTVKAASTKNDIIVKEEEKEECTPETCDESKGLACQQGACKCRNSRDLFIEEFGRCLNSTLQDSLREALTIMDDTQDEIKTFAKTLEKYDDAEHEAHGSINYNNPVHQLVRLFGEDDDDEFDDKRHMQYVPSTTPTSRSKFPPATASSNNGDLYSAAQEPEAESAVPGSGATPRGPPPSRRGPEPSMNPVSFGHSGDDSEEAMTYRSSGESPGIHHTPQRRLALDNLQQHSQEPAIVERQAPFYHQSDDYPLHGLGAIPEGSNHLRIPLFRGLGGAGGGGGGGHHGFGHGLGGHGHHGGFGHHGLGHGLGQGGLGGFGHGLGGHGGLFGHHAPHHGLGGHGGGPGGLFGRGLGGRGGGGLGGGGGGLGGGGLGGGGFGGGGFGPGGRGGGGGEGGGGGGGSGEGGPRHKSLLVDLGEFVARSLKLMDRFLPLIHAVSDVVKKGRGGGGGGVGRRFGESSKGKLT